MSIARQALALAEREGRNVLGDALDFRRTHPYFFFLVHEAEATRTRKRGRRVLAFYHRRMRDYYATRWRASSEVNKCLSAELKRFVGGV